MRNEIRSASTPTLRSMSVTPTCMPTPKATTLAAEAVFAARRRASPAARRRPRAGTGSLPRARSRRRRARRRAATPAPEGVHAMNATPTRASHAATCQLTASRRKRPGRASRAPPSRTCSITPASLGRATSSATAPAMTIATGISSPARSVAARPGRARCLPSPAARSRRGRRRRRQHQERRHDRGDGRPGNGRGGSSTSAASLAWAGVIRHSR